MVSDFLLAVILGIIEGVTEFLPISSTAHLRIAQSLMGLNLEDSYWKMFAIVIQLGAILSVFIYFRERIRMFSLDFLRSSNKLTHPVTLVMLAFFVTAVPAFLLSKVIGENLESLRVIGSSLVLGGIAMWVVDRVCTKAKTTNVESISPIQAIGIGTVQILSAVFPGTSRSMSTIAGGQMLGLSRAAALEFSFFVSLPTMVAATAYDLMKSLLHPEQGHEITMGLTQWINLGVGFVVSFVVALGVIAWFMNWVKTKGFVPFAVYRIAIGLLVLFYLA